MNLKHILLIDDDKELAQLLSDYLTNEGFSLSYCQDGITGLSQAYDDNIDLILLDVMMPGMDGPSTLAELRKIPKLTKTPVMFMTAKVQPQEVEFLKSLNVADVIAKPFDPMGLANNIRDSWEKAI